jgi:hypothetical protein
MPECPGLRLRCTGDEGMRSDLVIGETGARTEVPGVAQASINMGCPMNLHALVHRSAGSLP